KLFGKNYLRCGVSKAVINQYNSVVHSFSKSSHQAFCNYFYICKGQIVKNVVVVFSNFQFFFQNIIPLFSKSNNGNIFSCKILLNQMTYFFYYVGVKRTG